MKNENNDQFINVKNDNVCIIRILHIIEKLQHKSNITTSNYNAKYLTYIIDDFFDDMSIIYDARYDDDMSSNTNDNNNDDNDNDDNVNTIELNC